MATSENLQLELLSETELQSMQSVAGSRAKTCPSRDSRPASMRSAVVSGASTRALLASFDQQSFSWRTSQTCLLAHLSNQADGLAEFSATWPRSGMMLAGKAYQLPTLAPLTGEIVSGLLPTPRANDAQKRGHFNVNDLRNGFPAAAKRLMIPTPMAGMATASAGPAGPAGARKAWKRLLLPTISKNEFKGSSRDRFRGSPNFHGAKMSEALRTSESDPIYLNPSFGELVMGFPIGWTVLPLSETP